MPAWLLAALNMIRTGLIGTPGRALATGAGVGLAVPDSLGFIDPISGAFAALGSGGDGRRRRRRRRALTASDKADIAFVVGLMGPKAGKDFATIIATRAH